MDNNLVLIKEVIHHYLPDSKVMLFGSRARNEPNKHSDYDILVSTHDDLNSDQQKIIPPGIRRELAKFDIDVDLIIKSESEIERKRKSVGNIVYYAVKDAIEI